MREIKFRGKRFETEDWVYGDLIRHYENQRRFIACDQLAYTYSECGIDRLVTESFYEVSPETVGQYTGLKDKNGREIYEGDIVIDRYANTYTPIFRNGIYMAYNTEQMDSPLAEPSTQFNVVWRDGCEVIGNIYENPELVEAKND